MPFIPAICNDITCRAIYPSDFTIDKTNEPNTQADTNIPCPTCGATGSIANTNYNTLTQLLADKITNTADIQLCKKIHKKIDKTLKKNKPHKTLNELEKVAASWEDIWKQIPEDTAEAYACLRLVFSFVSTAITTHAELANLPDKVVLINKSYNHYYQLVAPSLSSAKKRPQIKALTDAIRKTQ